ncbi:hypothetical protein I6E09_12395 [Mediterraneibacter glycyrrhizinilyticus]|uniref:hypothetical protein n=1 Tax=Mediterraneibacter glycyrrhizinilyticus TaxID=342942 RepID=UPI00265B6AAF|nr:hypothetical protein [Mediterraneibacter glycyrrhizinilyticus]MCF2569959.1 hypothetical protein [Mediterraneibacter glycyrrhizinilyticus]
MGAYGVHPTRYGNLSNDQLYAMFRESTYSKLGESEKLELLQETVNRDALEKGEVGAPEVRFADLPANESGNAANGVINVNRDMAVNGMQSFEYNGQTIQHLISDYNVQSLNTVLHENTHCFQDQIIDGTITIEDAQKTAEYQANSFTSSAVLQDGRYQLGSQYLTGETANGYYCYYFQSTERDAFLGAEERTAAILSGLTEKYGTEPSFEAYAKSVESTGYHATEREAIERFQNPNFERDLNQTLQNQYFGTNVPVDKNTEAAVKAEMVATYKSLQQQITQANNLSAKENAKMSFDPNKPVSLEEYNATLRDSVNAYYEHAMNDPTMSKEEAIKSTAEMSEKYIDAVQEFQESLGMQTTVGVSMNEGVQSIGSNGIQADADALDTTGISAGDTAVDSGVSGDGIGADDSGGVDNDGDGVDDGMDI